MILISDCLRLADAGMLPAVEDKLLALRDYIMKVSRFRGGVSREQGGLIDIGLETGIKWTEKLSLDEPRRSDSGEEWRTGESVKSETDRQLLQAPCRLQLTRLISEKR